MSFNNVQDFLDFGGKNIICNKVYGGFTAPEQVAYNTVLPPPLGVGGSGNVVSGTAPVSVNTSAGVSVVSLDPTSLVAQNPGPLTTDYVIVYDTIAQGWVKVALSNIISPGSGTVTSVAMTTPTGLAVSGSPITTNGTLGLTWSGTIPNAQIPTFNSSTNGGVPASGGGTVNFLRADGAWQPPPGGGGGGSSNFIYATSNFIAVNLTGYLLDSSAASFTVTLPASPVVGNWVQLMDSTSSWGTHNVTISGNGSNINSSSANFLLTIGGSVALFSYVNSTIGWKSFTL